MLYYSLIHSRPLYRILVWGNANKTYLNAPKISQNKILRILLSSDIYTPISELYPTLDILNLDSIYELEVAKFIHQLQYQKLAKICLKLFTKLGAVYSHEHYTRQKQS